MKASIALFALAASALAILSLAADTGEAPGFGTGSTSREYSLLFGGIDDPATFARAGVNFNKAMTDAYYYGLGTILPPTVDNFAATAWQIWWSILTRQSKDRR